MWIVPPSIRSAFSRESGCLTKDCTPDLDLWASEAERSCTLNGKPTRSQSWKQGCKKAPYLMRLSGLAICANLTQSSFQAWWIASLRASRAKTSALPADAPGLMASAAGCSLKSPASPVIAVRDTSFWRTSQASLLPPPPLWTKPKANWTNAQQPASWENWPTTGGMRNGQLFQRPTLEPATGGRGGFAGHGGRWDTPDGMPEAPNTGSNRKAQVAGLGNQAQQVMARQWATPDCNTSTYSNGKMGPNIREQAAAWPTPRTTDTNQGRGSVLIGSAYYRPSKALSAGELVGQANLADVAQMWPTPMASDDGHKVTINSNQAGLIGASHQFMECQFSPQAQPTRPGPESSSNGPTSPRRLNPAFTEWLMGWPTGWTIAAPSASSAAETVLWRCKLQQRLCNLS